MTENELLEFVSRIIASGREENIKYSVLELKKILEREGESSRLIDLIDGLDIAAPEAAELGEKSRGRAVTWNEIGRAIREGRERERRRMEYRC